MHRREFLKHTLACAAALTAQSPADLVDAAQAHSPSLLWYLENWTGRSVSSWQADRLANPASVTKMATSLLALHRYSPSYRYETTFCPKGSIDLSMHTLQGDLHIYGSGDPDFHFENALFVAAALNRLGIERITGDLVLYGHFHMRWDNGRVPKNQADWEQYVVRKGARLRQVWNPEQWDSSDKETWMQLTQQHSVRQPEDALNGFSSLTIQGKTRAEPAVNQPTPKLAVIHYSNPMLRMLKRFNSYSNNDIERIGQQLGGASALERFLAEHAGLQGKRVQFSSTSGLDENRLSPRASVQIVRSLIGLGEKHHFELADVLPVAGVDEGTLSSRFSEQGYSGAVVAKSGQLVWTDGGVSTLSGVTYTQKGPLLFAIFHLRARRRLVTARSQVDSTLLKFIQQMGGPAPLDYNPETFPTSYDQVRIETMRRS